ncbi:MAG: hypothetical protein MR601_07215 [Erysipelotrichaceae bacterium]|nr:hypothetical protein [Erysipelotrichaceae bacterium]
MLNILFYSKDPEINYKISKKSFILYLAFITLLFPILCVLKNVYISFVICLVLLVIGIIELNIAKRMVNVNELKCLEAYKKGKIVNIISKVILMVIVLLIYT